LVSGVKDNFTRFYILANHPSLPLPNTRGEQSEGRNAVIRLEVLPRMEPQDAPVTISDLLAALHLSIVRVDRRPSTSVPRERFGNVYFVEVMDDQRSDGSRSLPQQQPQQYRVAATGIELSLWKERVLEAVACVIEKGGRADLLGTW
jgi:prephenate dehydratase